jgi:arginine N-succinyltransferase
VFVLEDSETGQVGICALEAAVGLKEPWYNYRVGTIVHASDELGVYSRHETLFLSNDHTGYSELCTLFLHPDFRANRNGGLLSKSRFLFLAQFPQLFGKTVVAEMRGVSDAEGRSPFWEGLGRHFFSIDFARRITSPASAKGFRGRADAQASGVCRLSAGRCPGGDWQDPRQYPPAVAMLESEGFRYEAMSTSLMPVLLCRRIPARSVR